MHYNEGQWADFVRGLVGGELATQMQSHLDSGCRGCSAIASTLRTTEETARRDRELPVPADVFQRAISVFRRAEKSSWLDLPRQVAVLVFDSLKSPALANARAVDSAARHASFEFAPYRIDIRLEHEPRFGPLSLTGQISAADASAGSTLALPVHLICDDGQPEATVTSEFGEFHFEAGARRLVKLVFVVDQGTRAIEVEIDTAS